MLFDGNGIQGRKILTRWHRGKFDYFHGTEGIDEIFDGIEGILSLFFPKGLLHAC